MKNLLAKFYKSLTSRVALAIIATATVAKAHDLPQHFSLAPTDWGMIQQDCMGYQSAGKIAMDLKAGSSRRLVEIDIAQPDAGNPPEPQAIRNSLAGNDLIGPPLYDGVDCAKLESYYRNVQCNHLADPLLEYKQSDSSAVVAKQLPAKVAEFEFHKSFFSACSCDFERQQANQSITPPRFTLKRTYVEDYFASEFNALKPLVLRDLSNSQFSGIKNGPLAIAIPTTLVKNKQIFANVLSQLISYDCIARSEFHSCQRAFELGEVTGSLAKTWFAETLPSASNFIAEYAQSLKPSKTLTTPSPMFVIFRTAAGNEVAISISQAKQWERTTQEAENIRPVAISQEFRDLVDSANARLHWAGGRLSAAASYMNEWFSDRLARAESNDLR